jgi:hypothetical protein
VWHPSPILDVFVLINRNNAAPWEKAQQIADMLLNP